MIRMGLLKNRAWDLRFLTGLRVEKWTFQATVGMTWTTERLVETVKNRLQGRELVIVSNREPYVHRFHQGRVECIRPVGGLTAALDPIMKACGGVWIAHGSGDADRFIGVRPGLVRVPPDAPAYSLRRVWVSREQEDGFYYGFSNSGLWPLCHELNQPFIFEEKDWKSYQEVNRHFARAILEELAGKEALIFIQDYHFALLPQMLKQARPDLKVAHFWHIPWPTPEAFRHCPFGESLLQGLLGSDLIGFQTQVHCERFLKTVDQTIANTSDCQTDRERFTAVHRNHETRIEAFPLSIDPSKGKSLLGIGWKERCEELRKEHGIGNRRIVVGVDRLDYTKGIPERLRAIDAWLEAHPEEAEGVRFVLIGAPSRMPIPSYHALNREVAAMVEKINEKFGTDEGKPMVFIHRHLDQREIHLWYRMADVCMITSLHDGMNLVAKEFVSCRDDEDGVLILSQFTGAVRELTEALIINPHDVSQTAETLQQALVMEPEQRTRRIRFLRQKVQDNNIFRWAGMLLSSALKLFLLCSSGKMLPIISCFPLWSVAA